MVVGHDIVLLSELIEDGADERSTPSRRRSSCGEAPVTRLVVRASALIWERPILVLASIGMELWKLLQMIREIVLHPLM